MCFMTEDKSKMIYENKPLKDMLEKWLQNIEHIKKCTQIDSEYEPFDIMYPLFPLVEQISYTLYKTGPRKYLEVLGIESSLANLIVEAYRNGYAHYNAALHLKYIDGVVICGEITSKSSGNLPPWNDEDEIIYYDGNNASIVWDSLLTRIEADIKTIS